MEKYGKIVNPYSNRKVKITSRLGQQIIQEYLHQAGGELFNPYQPSPGDNPYGKDIGPSALSPRQADDLGLVCPGQKPFLCTTQSKSYGLCRENPASCNKITSGASNTMPEVVTTGLVEGDGAAYGYHTSELMNSCYTENPIVDFRWDNPNPHHSHRFEVGTEVSIITYNIWGLNKGGRDKSFMKRRMQKIRDILLECDADIICLQEMSELAYQLLIDKFPELQEKYPYLSESPYRTVASRDRHVDVFWMSKYQPESVTLLSIQGNLGHRNPFLCVVFQNLILVNVYTQSGSSHSPGQQYNWIHYARCRRESFQVIREYIANLRTDEARRDNPIANVVLCGDFNCDLDGDPEAEWPELRELAKMRLSDTWRFLKPATDPGYTEDTEVNKMRWNQKQIHKQFRYDAILYTGNLDPLSIRIIGDLPFTLTPEESRTFLEGYRLDEDKVAYANRAKTILNWWPSDHFGLFTQYRILPDIQVEDSIEPAPWIGIIKQLLDR